LPRKEVGVVGTQKYSMLAIKHSIDFFQVFPCTNPKKLTSGSIAHLNYYNFSKVSTATELYKIEEKWLMEKGLTASFSYKK
jgi:hypothetical protein